MIVLGIDTSTSQTSVALWAQGEVVGAMQFAGARKHDDVVPDLPISYFDRLGVPRLS